MRLLAFLELLQDVPVLTGVEAGRSLAGAGALRLWRRGAVGGHTGGHSRRIPATIAELEADGEATVLRMRADSLSWVAGLLASLGCPFAILEPDALRAHVRELATSLVASATV
jgi:hypothetical protein